MFLRRRVDEGAIKSIVGDERAVAPLVDLILVGEAALVENIEEGLLTHLLDELGGVAALGQGDLVVHEELVVAIAVPGPVEVVAVERVADL